MQLVPFVLIAFVCNDRLHENFFTIFTQLFYQSFRLLFTYFSNWIGFTCIFSEIWIFPKNVFVFFYNITLEDVIGFVPLFPFDFFCIKTMIKSKDRPVLCSGVYRLNVGVYVFKYVTMHILTLLGISIVCNLLKWKRKQKRKRNRSRKLIWAMRIIVSRFYLCMNFATLHKLWSFILLDFAYEACNVYVHRYFDSCKTIFICLKRWVRQMLIWFISRKIQFPISHIFIFDTFLAQPVQSMKNFIYKKVSIDPIEKLRGIAHSNRAQVDIAWPNQTKHNKKINK